MIEFEIEKHEKRKQGYHTGSEFKTANDLGIDVLVAIPTVAAQAPNPDYNCRIGQARAVSSRFKESVLPGDKNPLSYGYSANRLIFNRKLITNDSF